MAVWDIEVTDVFERWWDSLSDSERQDVRAAIDLLEVRGPALRFPHCSAVVTSRHNQMRELRIQHQGRPYRVLYAFDPKRMALILLGGDKTGKDRWYEVNVPVADKLFDEHLEALRRERKKGR